MTHLSLNLLIPYDSFFSDVLLKTVSCEKCRKLRINNTMFGNTPETVRFHFECGKCVIRTYVICAC